jgi:DNA-binding HxlR family transcriptional regulator
VLGKDYDGQECALASTLEVLGERWTLLIVRDAFFGVRRYSDWVARLDIPRAVLSDRLRGLVASGILAKRADPERAGRELYVLTEAGTELWPGAARADRVGRAPPPAVDEPLPPRGVRHRARPRRLVPGMRRRAGGRRRAGRPAPERGRRAHRPGEHRDARAAPPARADRLPGARRAEPLGRLSERVARLARQPRHDLGRGQLLRELVGLAGPQVDDLRVPGLAPLCAQRAR